MNPALQSVSARWGTKWPQWISWLSALMVVGVGITVLVGWAINLAVLESIQTGWPGMSPLTAFCFILLGAGVGLAPSVKNRIKLERVALALAGVVVILALVRLICHGLGWHEMLMDRLWFFPVADTAKPPEMSLATALTFCFAGGSLWLAVARRMFALSQVLIIAVALMGWLGLCRYIYGGETPWFYAHMSAHAAVCFLILSVGVLCLWSEAGIMELLSSDTVGGVTARRLFIPVFTVPLFMGWLTQEGQYLGWYDDEAAHSLFALSSVIVFGAAVWMNAHLMHMGDKRRREIESRLRASLKEIKDLQKALDEHAIVAVTDPRGRITFVNDKFCEISQYSRTELVGQDHRMVNSGHHSKEFIRDLWTTIKQGKVWKGEICNRAKDGSFYWLHTTIVPFLDAQSKPYQYVAIRADITEKKHAELKVRSQLERLNLLHQITRAIGERQDLRSILQVAVGSVEEQLPLDLCCMGMYDKERNELVITCVGGLSGRLAMDLAIMEEAHIAIDQNGLSRCVRGQLVYEADIKDSDFPFPKRLARGGLRSLVVAPLQVESNVFGVIVAARRSVDAFSSGECEFLRQLSEHVALAAHQAQLHTALQQAFDDLRRSQQTVLQQERLSALGQMASGVAHDINNALSPATLYLSAMLDDEDSTIGPQDREYLQTVQCAVEDVAATVARMREFYRPREEHQPLVPVDLNHLVKQVIDLTRAKWKDMMLQRGVTILLRMDLSMELPPITAVESEIREALINLVFNAVDAMPTGGTLTITTRNLEHAPNSDKGWVGRFVAVEVTDTGMGMDEETRRRCLEPFYTTKGERGTGLGLAMVYGVAQRHCAEVEIESELGVGTTMRLCFPLPLDAVSEDTQPLPKLEIRPGQHILVVDDDPLLLKSMRDILETNGHEVVTANGGQAGIDRFRQSLQDNRQFSIVFTDLGMPNVDGRKVAAAIKGLAPDLPVIMLTGWGERLTAEGDCPENVDLILSKPPKLREIREALARGRAT